MARPTWEVTSQPRAVFPGLQTIPGPQTLLPCLPGSVLQQIHQPRLSTKWPVDMTNEMFNGPDCRIWPPSEANPAFFFLQIYLEQKRLKWPPVILLAVSSMPTRACLVADRTPACNWMPSIAVSTSYQHRCHTDQRWPEQRLNWPLQMPWNWPYIEDLCSAIEKHVARPSRHEATRKEPIRIKSMKLRLISDGKRLLNIGGLSWAMLIILCNILKGNLHQWRNCHER